MRRTLALWLLLFGVYAATIGLPSFGESDYGGDEPHYLLAAESIVEDGDVDVRDEYAERAFEEFYPYDLDRHGRPVEGRLNEPHGVGFPLLIAPAYALGGAKAVELFLAAIAALGGGARVPARAAGRARPVGARGGAGRRAQPSAAGVRVGGLPGARGGDRARGSGAAGGEARRARLAARHRGCFLLLGSLPWLGTKFVPAGLVVAAFAARAIWRTRRRTLAVAGVELSLVSVAMYVAVNEAVYGGPTPYAADVPGETATDAAFPVGYLERVLPARRAVPRPRVRPAALGAGVRARVRGRLVPVAVAPRPAGAGGAGRAPHRAGGGHVRGGARRPAARGRLPRAHDVRLLVPAAPPARGAPRSRSRSSRGASGTCRGWARRWPRSRSAGPPGSTPTCAGARARS